MDSPSSSSSSSSSPSPSSSNAIRKALIGMGYPITHIDKVMARNPETTESAVGWLFTITDSESNGAFGDPSICAICYGESAPNAIPCHPENRYCSECFFKIRACPECRRTNTHTAFTTQDLLAKGIVILEPCPCGELLGEDGICSAASCIFTCPCGCRTYQDNGTCAACGIVNAIFGG